MESCCLASWTSWNRKDIAMPCSGPKVVYSTFSPVRFLPLSLISSTLNTRFRYTQARLLEIHSHSLFSKWFSESGKLVQRLFTSITELVEEEDGFVVVLIGTCIFRQYMRRNKSNKITDEVESLTAARAGAMAGTEPSDGLRVSIYLDISPCLPLTKIGRKCTSYTTR